MTDTISSESKPLEKSHLIIIAQTIPILLNPKQIKQLKRMGITPISLGEIED